MTTLHEAAAAVWSTLLAFAWLARNGLQDDKDIVACHEHVLDSLSDADLVAKLDCLTDGDLRSQLSVADAIALRDEAELARMGPGRN